MSQLYWRSVRLHGEPYKLHRTRSVLRLGSTPSANTIFTPGIYAGRVAFSYKEVLRCSTRLPGTILRRYRQWRWICILSFKCDKIHTWDTKIRQNKRNISLSVATTKRRNKNRQIIDAIKLKRGCLLCGYRRCSRALEFHHHNKDKLFCVSAGMLQLGLGMKRIEAEIEKCVLLCSNCHQEIESKEASVVQRLEYLTFNQADDSSNLSRRTSSVG